ncbi:MAG: nodulation protein NfeD [Candidatus Riflebacteria bacterium]|nr:nodulation protein NfeD [Candidatus Riflebacteria bacterium]
MEWKVRLAKTLTIVGLVLLVAGQIPAQSPPPREPEVLLMTVKGVINPLTEEYFTRALKEAQDRHAALLLVEMDTPGGLMESMWGIIKGIVNSRVPVAVYVCPQGGHAASAGTFILMAAHIAAMAPSTTIGAAHPVGIMPTDDDKKDVSMQKLVNDAVTRMRQNAERHGRNAAWAEKAVRESATIGTDEAVKQLCVDLKADSRDKLLEAIEGRKVVMADGKREIRVRGARIVELPMTFREEVLHTISHPTISYGLLMLGIAAIGFEVTHPGAIFPGVVGVLALGLAMMGFKFLPINYVGLLLIFFSFVFFIAELKLATAGLLTLAGIVSLVLGSLLLIDSPLPFLQVSRPAIAAMGGSIAALFIFVVGRVVRDMARPVTTGLQAMVGQEGYATEEFAREGMVKVAGELWKAVLEGEGPMKAGDRVKVVAATDDRLTVVRLK